MADIQHLMKMLQSEDSKERYDACEKLRGSSSLPPEAIQALRFTTSDANPKVAEAAQRAIMRHTSDASNSSIFDKNAPQDRASISGATSPLTWTAVLVFIALGLTFCLMSLLPAVTSGPGQGGIILVPFFLAWLIVVISAVVTGFKSTRSEAKNRSSAYLYLMITLAVGSVGIMVIPPLREGSNLLETLLYMLLCASPALVGVLLAIFRLRSPGEG